MDMFDHHVGPTMIFWIIIGIIAIASIFFRYRESVQRHKTLQILAEKGQPIPPEFFRESRYGYRDRYYGRGGARRGLVLMAIGVAIFIFLSGMMGGFTDGVHVHMGPGWVALAGIFPFMIGLAIFVGGLFDRRDPPDPKP